MIHALIIEDERKAALELKSMIHELRPEIIFYDVIESVEEAIQWLRNNVAPGLIFSDIQLSDGLSFEIFRQVKVQSPIIFCTAFDEYMLDAFNTYGIYYLLKPISKSKLEESLKKYDELCSVFSRSQHDYAGHLANLLLHIRHAYPTSLLIHHGEKITPVKTEDIGFLYYDKGVVNVTLITNQHFYIQETLDDLEKKLDPRFFYRANRQFIVNRKSIHEIERYFSRRLVLKLTMKTPETIIIGKVKVTPFLNWVQDKNNVLNNLKKLE
jgi:two-component system response regulator LytT